MGEERQKEALQAAKKLGLKEEDVFFLSYPDAGLDFLWKEGYNTGLLNQDSEPYALYKSATTKKTYSPYKKTYSRAKEGYTKENILTDIKDILTKYQPRRIYFPYFLDQHRDHSATARFVNRALKELIWEGRNKWISFIDVFYYSFHNPEVELYSQQENYKENTSNFKNQKAGAIREYRTQMHRVEQVLKRRVRDEEVFYQAPQNKRKYLEDIEDEWVRIAEIMRKRNYNVNFAPVVDVAGNTEDMGIYLAKRERMYSHDPHIVTQIAYRAIKGMNQSGITAVLKHFPGLGRCSKDSHNWLPEILSSKKELYRKDLLPFKELIKKKDISFWIMVDHAIYPSLDEEPASLSYKIQAGLLRKQLHFKGIIIADELLCMQAIQEYARKKEIKEPYIGEVIVKAFQAGTDLVIVYPQNSREAEKIIPYIIKAVKQAVKEERVSQKDIDDSLKRIFRSKENIFRKPLIYLLKEMSLEEKICQKIVMDAFENTEIFKKYNLGGMHARRYAVIEEAQKNLKIPMFIIAQHEGGLVNDSALKLYTRSAYSMGTELERLAIKAGDKLFPASPKAKPDLSQQQNNAFIDYNHLDKGKRKKVIYPLLASMNRLIALWSRTSDRYGPPYIQPNLVSALVFYHGEFSLLAYEDLPMDWVRRFPDRQSARCAYELLKKIFKDWQAQCIPSNELPGIISNLKSLKKEIERIRLKEDNILDKLILP